MDRPRTWAGVFLLSAAMLALELTLTRLLAVQQFYHFAFLVISLALLGLGTSGSLLVVRPRLEREPWRWAAAFGVTAAGGLAVLQLVPLDTYAMAWEPRQLGYLFLTLTGLGTPFLFSGLAIGALLSADAASLHRIYGANLSGSALGSVGTLLLLEASGGAGAVLLCAAGGLLAAVLLLPEPFGRPMWSTLMLSSIVACGVLTALDPPWMELRLSPYKGLSQALRAADASHSVSRWSAVARVDVVESSSIHSFPGLAQGAVLPEPPPQAGVTVDGGNLSPLTGIAPDDPVARALADAVPMAVVDVLRGDGGHRLVMEPRGGWSVLMALAGDERARVTAVERFDLVADVVRKEYGPFIHDLFADPRVELMVEHPRGFARTTDGLFDVVHLGLSDTYQPVTSGAYSLGEDYRFTVEAFADYLSLLDDDGLLVWTRWLQRPPTESVRALATLRSALDARGMREPAAHLAAFRSLRTMTLIGSMQPLTTTDRDRLRAFVDDLGYDLVWLPGIDADEVNRNLRLPEPMYHRAFSEVLEAPEEFIATYDYDVRPATDDRPFPFHYFRWRQTPQILAALGTTWQPFGGSGYLVVVALLLIVTAMAAVLILGPLALARAAPSIFGVASGPGTDVEATHERGLAAAPWGIQVRAILYVGLIGLAYFFVLMPLAQQLILFLGEPVVALSVVFFTVLLFSGIGSTISPRVPLGPALGILVALIVVMPVGLARLAGEALGSPIAWRIALTVIVLAPLGVVMGVPFAAGVRRIEDAAPGLVAWAWAINGSASVVGTVLAIMIALSHGFSAVLWIGAACYGLAWLAIRGMPGRGV